MIEKILENENFIALMQKNCYDLLSILIQENIEFSVVANTNFIDFDPVLPENLDVKQNPFALFVLGGYTFESIQLEKNHIQFHAGFGPDDFASYVKVDLGAITQIQVENSVLFVNFSFYKRKDNTKSQKSKNIFLSNPKNKDIFKK